MKIEQYFPFIAGINPVAMVEPERDNPAARHSLRQSNDECI